MDLTTSADAFPSERPPSIAAPPTAAAAEARPAPPVSGARTQAPASSAFLKLVWVVSLLGGVGASLFGFLALSRADTVPQQAAAAAIACLIALAPYVIARSIQELAR